MSNLIIKGKANWVKVFEPDTKFNPTGDYTIDVIAPADDPATVAMCERLDGIVQEAFNDEVKNKPQVKNTLSTRSSYKPEMHYETGEPTGNLVFKFKMKAEVRKKDGTTFSQQPVVVDAKRQPVDRTVGIGNGSVVKVAFDAAPYVVQGTAGVAMRLKAVQVIELIEYSGTGGDSLFDEEDGFEGAATPADTFTMDNATAGGDF